MHKDIFTSVVRVRGSKKYNVVPVKVINRLRYLSGLIFQMF